MDSAEIDAWWKRPDQRDQKSGRFMPGNIGGGRKKGSRALFTEAAVADLFEDWKAHGIQVIKDVRERRPWDYLRIVAAIISRGEGFREMADGFNDEALEQIIEERRRQAVLTIEKMREPQ